MRYDYLINKVLEKLLESENDILSALVGNLDKK